MELWNHVQGALVGVAGARIKSLIQELVPGFDGALIGVLNNERRAIERRQCSWASLARRSACNDPVRDLKCATLARLER